MIPTDLNVLECAYHYHHGSGPTLDKALLFNFHIEEIKDKIKKLIRQGYLNYKLNIYTSWITIKGKDYLKEILRDRKTLTRRLYV